MRRVRHRSHLLWFLAFVGVVMLGAFMAKDWVTRATVGDVELAVQRGATVDAETARHLTVAGRHLPDWTDLGWTLRGGRTDQFEDDREAITGLYVRGDHELSVTIVDGDAGLEDSAETSGALDCSAGCSGPVSRPALYVKRDLPAAGTTRAATVVVVGSPVDDRTRAALREVTGQV